jgi:hypothetical protein
MNTNNNANKGIASLPAIMLMGAIIVEIAIASMFLLTYLNNSVYGTRLANQAFIAARTGINDGISRLILDKNLDRQSYSIVTAGATADVLVCKEIFFYCDGSATISTGKHQIVSTGRALTRKHRVVALITVSSTTGLVTVDSIKDQP